MRGYPRHFRPLLWGTLGALFVTGLLLVPSALEMRLEWELPWRPGPGFRLPVAATHALFAFVALFILGALSALHVRAGLRRRRNVIWGLTLLSSFVLLALSALGIYYFGEERTGAWASAIHLVFGLLAPLPMAAHALSSRRLQRAAPGAQSQPAAVYSAPHQALAAPTAPRAETSL